MRLIRYLIGLSDLKNASDLARVIALFMVMMNLGLLSLLFPAISRVGTDTGADFWSVIGSGLYLAGASAVSGCLVGFVFGIPRSGSQDREQAMAANTNLEQVSDWITKILIGIGISQVHEISETFSNVVKFLGPAFGSSPTGELFAGSIIVHFVIAGFFLGYLLTRMFLPGALSRAHRSPRTAASEGDVE